MVGCSGSPADSHDVLWFMVRKEKLARCTECGSGERIIMPLRVFLLKVSISKYTSSISTAKSMPMFTTTRLLLVVP